MSSNTVQITAVSVYMGVITLIEPNGEIGMYKQKGVAGLGLDRQRALIMSGRLSEQALCLPEIPSNYSISFEEPSIMGRALKTFKG